MTKQQTRSTGRPTARPTARQATVQALLHEAGRTYAAAAGIRMADQPAPLFQLLALANLLSTRIKAEIAVAAAREIFAAGGTTYRGMAGLTWQQRVDALGRGSYVRYDESTSTRLGEVARLVGERYHGDLRELAAAADHQPSRVRTLLREFPGIGPTGADIFCREAQAVWPWLRPYLDGQARKGAGKLGLPEDAGELAALVDESELARFAAGLVRVALDRDTAERVVSRVTVS